MQIEQLKWDSICRAQGECLVIDFDARPRHIAIIPFEVLEDGLQTMNEEPLSSAKQHRSLVIAAISKALDGDDWRELVNIGTGQTLFQLWIGRKHFGK